MELKELILSTQAKYLDLVAKNLKMDYIDKKFYKDAESYARFIREAKILIRLEYHPNVVYFLGVEIFWFKESDSWNCPTINYILASVN